jgi:CHAD domain-containing protein
VPARTTREGDGPERLRGELKRTLADLETELDQELGQPAPTPEDVHRIHQDLRRLASGLTVWDRIVPARHRSEAREVQQRLRRLARLVGRVRDRDITAGLLAPASGRSPPSRNPEWVEFLGRLRDDTRTGRELLQAFLRTERRGGLLVRVGRLLERPVGPEARRDLGQLLGREGSRRHGRLAKAHRKARERPTSARLHRLRIRIRQWRHFNGLANGVRRARGGLPSPAWQRLQERLGNLHDLDVALATVPDDLADTAAARRLRRDRRRLLASVQAALDRLEVQPRPPSAARRVRAP